MFEGWLAAYWWLQSESCDAVDVWADWSVVGTWRMLVALVGTVGVECRCCCRRSYGVFYAEAAVGKVVVGEGEDFLVRAV